MSLKESEVALKNLAKALAVRIVRNTSIIEYIHAGTFPRTKTGDYSDVKVIDAEGREIRWNDVAHITQEQMKAFNKEVVNNFYEYLVKSETPEYIEELSKAGLFAWNWDDPELPKKQP